MKDNDINQNELAQELKRLRLENAALKLQVENQAGKVTGKELLSLALAASEAKFYNLVDNINDVIYSTDAEANITFVSPSIRNLLGFQPEDIIGKNFTAFIGEKGESLGKRFEEIQNKFDLQNDYKIVSPIGEAHWIRLSSKAQFKDGVFNGVTGILIDVTVTKNIELELQKSEALYRSILNASPDTIFIADLSGKITFVSSMALTMFRFTDTSVPLHKSLYNFLDIKDHNRAQSAINAMKEEAFSGDSEYTGIRADGSTFDMEVNGEFIRDAAGHPTSMVFTVRDVSERKLTEKKLIKSEEKYRRLVESITDVVFEISMDGTIRYVSPSINKLLNIKVENLLGQNFLTYVHPDDRVMVTDILINNRFDEFKKLEYRCLSDTNRTVWVQISAQYTYEDGQIAGRTGILHDITEQKTAEGKLNKSEEQYRRLVESVNDVIYEVDAKGAIKFVSPSVNSVLGYTVQEVLGRNIFDFVHPNDTPAIIATLAKLNEKDYHYMEYRYLRKDGSIHWVRSSTSPILEDGIVVGGTGILTDITDRIITQEALQKSEERFSQIVQQTRTVIWEVDISGLYTYVSPLSKNVWGYSPEELIGKKHFYDLHPEEGREEFKIAALESILKKETFLDLINQIVTGENILIWVSTNGAPILNEQNELIGYRGADNDITERMLALEELIQSEDRYKSIFKNNRSVMLILDPDTGEIKDANASACSYYKYSYEELCQKKIAEINPQPEVEILVQLKRSIEEKHSHYYFKHLLGTGEIRDVEVYSSPIKFGNSTLIYSIIHDITDRIQAEEAVKIRQAELNEAQKIARMCSWELNPVTEKLTWSENYYHVMGIPEGSEMKTESFRNQVHPEDLHLVDEKLQELIETQKPVGYDLRILMPDNHYNWIQNNIVPEFEKDKLINLRGVNIDVTDKKINEEKIKSQNDRLNAIINAVPDLMLVLDRNGTNLEFYTKFPENLLLPREKFLGSNLRDLFDAETAEMNIRKIKECIDRQILITHEFNLHRAGTNQYFEARMSPFGADKVLTFIRDISDKKLKEIEINKLTRAVEQSPVSIVITNLKGTIEYANPMACKSSGYTFEEFFGNNPRVLKSGETRNEEYRLLWDTIVKGNQWHGILHNKKKNGELYWESTTISPIIDAEGRISHFLAIKEDITSRKQTEEYLIQSEESYRHMFGNNPQPMWIYDLETLAFLEINDAAVKHYGYSREEFLAMTLLDIRPPEDIPALLTDDELTKRTFNTAGEWRHLKKNGELIFVEITSHAIRFNDREARHILVKDITERKKVEREIRDLNLNLEQKIEQRTTQLSLLNINLLKEIEYRKQTEKALSVSEKSYRLVVENVNEIIFQTDAEGLWIFLNKSWEKVTGFTIGESLGKQFLDYVHPDDRERNNALFMPLIKREKEYCRHEVRYLTKDGHFRWIEVFARLGLNERNEITGTYGTLQDITERKKTDEIIQNARLEAEKANLAKSEFLSRMSHELRTPMNSILGFAQLLDYGELDPKQRKSIGYILRSGRHLLELINEVLDISRIEAGHLTIHPEPIAINRLNQEILEVVTPMANDKQIRLEISTTLDNHCKVYTDNQRLKQVLLNLVNNAIKYNRTGGAVNIHSELKESSGSEPPMIRIAVIDTGIGISETDLPNIFTPFERIGAERTVIEGTGLGLAVVKQIMQALGGTCGVESIMGEGSNFWIELPQMIVEQNPLEFLDLRSSFPEPKNKAGLILYIEDNDSNFELVEQFLAEQRNNTQLLTTAYGKMAVPISKQYHPDLILLDLNLPDIDGIKVLENLKSDPLTSNIPVVVVSADAMRERSDSLQRYGAKQYLTKPLNLVEFLDVIDKYLPTS